MSDFSAKRTRSFARSVLVKTFDCRNDSVSKEKCLFFGQKDLYLCMRVFDEANVAPSFCNAKLQGVRGFEYSNTSGYVWV